MNKKQFSFMSSVLGPDGATALKKAASRSSELSGAILPRAIMAWVTIASQLGYEGEIPGVDGTHIEFQKSEVGFSGSIASEGMSYKFHNASHFHVAATVAVALDAQDSLLDPALRDIEIEQLGKSIDVLAKAKAVKAEIEKAGVGEPGQAAKPEEQMGAVPPKAPEPQGTKQTKKGPKLPKVPQAPQVKLAMSVVGKSCPMCGKGQFRGEDFVACYCLKDLAKSVRVDAFDDCYILTLGPKWSKDDIKFLEEIFYGN